MSVRTMNSIATQRDLTKGAQQLERQPQSPEDAQKAETKGYVDLLVAAIPTEPLALYTFLIAGITMTIDPGSDERLTMRWIILAASAAFIALWMISSYRRQPGSKKRKLPWPEVTSAIVAFAAWGLVMPESPLAAELSSSNQMVWTYIIVAAAVAVLGLLTGSMKKPVKKEG